MTRHIEQPHLVSRKDWVEKKQYAYNVYIMLYCYINKILIFLRSVFH